MFDRSHYEDVLVVRVNELVPREVWEPRYDEINAFEKEVVDGGTTIIKVALMVSPAEQKARLRERLERPDKYWKYNPGDIDVRAQWPLYQEAYQAVLDRTSTDHAPWYVVPADSKWYARMAVGRLLRDALDGSRPGLAAGGLRRGGREGPSGRPADVSDVIVRPRRDDFGPPRCSGTMVRWSAVHRRRHARPDPETPTQGEVL